MDWHGIVQRIREYPPGTPFLVIRGDRSIASHMKAGKYKHIDPALYRIWTRKSGDGPYEIWMVRR